MKSRQVIMLRDLLHNEYVRPNEFMEKLGISLRTVRMEIHEINDILRHKNMRINSSSARGYFILKEERTQFYEFLNNMILSLKKVELPETLRKIFIYFYIFDIYKRACFSSEFSRYYVCIKDSNDKNSKGN